MRAYLLLIMVTVFFISTAFAACDCPDSPDLCGAGCGKTSYNCGYCSGSSYSCDVWDDTDPSQTLNYEDECAHLGCSWAIGHCGPTTKAECGYLGKSDCRQTDGQCYWGSCVLYKCCRGGTYRCSGISGESDCKGIDAYGGCNWYEADCSETPWACDYWNWNQGGCDNRVTNCNWTPYECCNLTQCESKYPGSNVYCNGETGVYACRDLPLCGEPCKYCGYDEHLISEILDGVQPARTILGTDNIALDGQALQNKINDSGVGKNSYLSNDFTDDVNFNSCYYRIECLGTVRGWDNPSNWGFTESTDLLKILNDDGSVVDRVCGECIKYDEAGDCVEELDCYGVVSEGDYCINKISCVDCIEEYCEQGQCEDFKYRRLMEEDYDFYYHCTWLPRDYGGWAGVREYCPPPGLVVNAGYYSLCYYQEDVSEERCGVNGCNVERDFMFGDNWVCDPEKGAILKIPCPTCISELVLQVIPSKLNFGVQNISKLTPPSRTLIDSCSCGAQEAAMDFVPPELCNDSLVIDEFHIPSRAPDCECPLPNKTLFLAMNWTDEEVDTGYFTTYNLELRHHDRCDRLFPLNDGECYWGGALNYSLSRYGLSLGVNRGSNLINEDVWCSDSGEGEFCSFYSNRLSRVKYDLKTLVDLTIYAYNEDNVVPVYLSTFGRGAQFRDDDGQAESNLLLGAGDVFSISFNVGENVTREDYGFAQIMTECFTDSGSVDLSVSLEGVDLGVIVCDDIISWHEFVFNPLELGYDLANDWYEFSFIPDGDVHISVDVDNDYQTSNYYYLVNDVSCSFDEFSPAEESAGINADLFNFLSIEGFDGEFFYVSGDSVFVDGSEFDASGVIASGISGIAGVDDYLVVLDGVGLYSISAFDVEFLNLSTKGAFYIPPEINSYDFILGADLVEDSSGDELIAGNESGVTIFEHQSPRLGGKIVIPTSGEVTMLALGGSGELFYGVEGEGVFMLDYDLIPELVYPEKSVFAASDFLVLDYDGDGDSDIIGLTGEESLGVYRNYGRLGFIPLDITNASPETGVSFLAAGDLNLNGVADFVFSNDTGKFFFAELVNSDFRFTELGLSPSGFNFFSNHSSILFINSGVINRISGFTVPYACDGLDFSSAAPLVRFEYGDVNPVTVLDQLFPDLIVPSESLKVNEFYDEISPAHDESQFGKVLFCGEDYWFNVSFNQRELRFEPYDYFNFTVRIDDMPVYCTNTAGPDGIGLPILKKDFISQEVFCHLPDCNHGFPRPYSFDICTRAGVIEYENCYSFNSVVALAGRADIRLDNTSPAGKFELLACPQQADGSPPVDGSMYSLFASPNEVYYPYDFNGLYDEVTGYQILDSDGSVVCSSSFEVMPSLVPGVQLISNCVEVLTPESDYKLRVFISDYYDKILIDDFSLVDWLSPASENCVNGVDDDCDTFIDCADDYCDGYSVDGWKCYMLDKVEIDCSDFVDNDGDSLFDCDDADCLGMTCAVGKVCTAIGVCDVSCLGTTASCCVAGDCASYCVSLTRYYSGSCPVVGSACSYSTQSCDDGVICSTDSCTAASCSNIPIADDTTVCDTGKVCHDGQCCAFVAGSWVC